MTLSTKRDFNKGALYILETKKGGFTYEQLNSHWQNSSATVG